ncbi:hypothetical protein FA13DRAFT_250995 [Coprinellus micaceus]|uniref:Uncharacterized protein n=1 Tax=Coprinellus micaceus TaxID=71717 RepID=A0A4Y7TEG3_COPMI|nr:hypothetical protein FA13DRAFT_250995 [Coprinellus micaceus]
MIYRSVSLCVFGGSLGSRLNLNMHVHTSRPIGSSGCPSRQKKDALRNDRQLTLASLDSSSSQSSTRRRGHAAFHFVSSITFSFSLEPPSLRLTLPTAKVKSTGTVCPVITNSDPMLHSWLRYDVRWVPQSTRVPFETPILVFSIEQGMEL